jgi:DNA polymerase zeta
MRSLDHAIAVSLHLDPETQVHSFVRSVFLVKGINFYGYHSSYSPFLKVLLVDPGMVARATAILRSGSVMSSRFCIFEGHLGYVLQFLADFGLYGCGWISLGEVFQRDRGVQEPSEEQKQLTGFKTSPYPSVSHMPLEVDATSYHILNRHQLVPRTVDHPIDSQSDTCEEEAVVLGVRELWADEHNRRKRLGLKVTPKPFFGPNDKKRSVGGGWSREADYKAALRQRMAQYPTSSLDNTDSNDAWHHCVMTTFESVQALWDQPWILQTSDNLDGLSPYIAKSSGLSQGMDSEADVDVSLLSNAEVLDELERTPEVMEESSDSEDDGPRDGNNLDQEESSEYDHSDSETDSNSNGDLTDDTKTLRYVIIHTNIQVFCHESQIEEDGDPEAGAHGYSWFPIVFLLVRWLF